MSHKSKPKRRSPTRRVTTVRDTKTGKVIRRTYTTKSGSTTRTYSGGRITSQTSKGSGAGMANPANVRAGIDASKIAMTKAAQTTATSQEISTYQKTGKSPAMVRVTTATQQARARSRTQVLEQRQKLMAAPPRIEEPRVQEMTGTRIGGVSGVGITSFTAEKLPSGMYKQTATQSITGRAQYFEYDYAMYEEPSIVSSTEKEMKKVTSWLDSKETDPSFIRGLKSGTKLGTYIVTEPFHMGIELLEKGGRKTVESAEKVSQYIRFDPSIFSLTKFVSKEERLIQQRPGFQDVFVQSRISEKESLTGTKRFFSDWFPAGTLMVTSTSDFQKEIKLSTAGLGYSEKEQSLAVKAASRQRYFSEGGEVAATIGAEVAAEITGAKLVGTGFKGLGLLSGSARAIRYKEFTTIAKGIAVAGAVEGSIQLGASKASTKTPTTRRERAFVAGTSAAIAAPIGGAIGVGSRYAPALATMVNIADPLEKVGDVIGGAITRTAPIKVFVPNLGTLYGTTKKGNGKGKSKSPIITPTYSTTKTYTVTKPIFSLTPTRSFSLTSTKTLIPTTSITPTKTIIPTRSFTPSRYGSGTPSILTPSVSVTPTSSPTPTPSFTTTTISTPTATGIFPFFDLGGFSKSTGLGVKIRSQRFTQYLPSIEAGLFGIKGKAPKYSTGIELRPLTKQKRRKRTNTFKINIAY